MMVVCYSTISINYHSMLYSTSSTPFGAYWRRKRKAYSRVSAVRLSSRFIARCAFRSAFFESRFTGIGCKRHKQHSMAVASKSIARGKINKTWTGKVRFVYQLKCNTAGHYAWTVAVSTNDFFSHSAARWFCRISAAYAIVRCLSVVQ